MLKLRSIATICTILPHGRRIAALAIAAALAAAAFARDTPVTAYWTGASDRYWTNSANWAGGVVPGLVLDGDGIETGNKNDRALFSGDQTITATSILTSGLTFISNVVFSGSVPAITFAQNLPMGQHGVFSIESDVENMPTFSAAFGFGSHVPPTENPYMSIYNKAAGKTLTILHWGLYTFEGKKKSNDGSVLIYGAGNVSINGWGSWDSGNGIAPSLYLYQEGDGRLIFNTTYMSVRAMYFYNSGTRKVEVPAGKILNMSGGGYNQFTAHTDAYIYGDGETWLSGSKGRNGMQGIDPGKTLWIDTFVTSRVVEATLPFPPAYSLSSGSGTMKITGPNYIPGPPEAVVSGITIDTTSMGLKGVRSQLGLGDGVRLANGGRLLYTGTGETTDRTITITNGTAVVEQGGTGPVVFNSDVVPEVSGCTLNLRNSTAYDATWAKGITAAITLKKEGTGRWILSGANTYTGKTYIYGGTLALAAGATLPSSQVELINNTTLEVLGGDTATAATLNVLAAGTPCAIRATGKARVTLNVTPMTQQGSPACRLNLTTEDDAEFVWPGATEATASPSWVTLNGKPATFAADGTMLIPSTATDTDIPARGGVIPNDPTAHVGITTAGDSGPITLAAASTQVKSLVQKTATAATVDLAAGETLSADMLAVDEGASALTIGSAEGQGTFATSASTLILANDSDEPLTVRSATSIPAGTAILKSGAGKVRLTSPLSWAGTLSAMEGTFAISNSTMFTGTLLGTGTFAKEGDYTWSPTVLQSAFDGDYLLAGGVTRPSKPGVFGTAVGALVVTNGATLDVNGAMSSANDMKFGKKEVRISGTGSSGQGAIYMGTTTGMAMDTFTRLTLDGDAKIGRSGTANTQLGMNYSSTAGNPMLNMNGHTLTLAGYGLLCLSNIGMQRSDGVTNAGPIVLESVAANASANNNLRIYYGFDLGGDNSTPLVMGDNTVLTLAHSVTTQRRSIEVDGPSAMINTVDASGSPGRGTNVNHLAGDITLKNANTLLKVCPKDETINTAVNLSGEIKGPGNLKLDGYGRVNLLSPSNSFTGTMEMDGNHFFSAFAAMPATLPDFSKVTIAGGRIAVPLADADGNDAWTQADVYRLANTMNTISNGLVAVDTTFSGDRTFTISDSDITRNDGFGIAHEGSNTLTVTGSSTKPFAFGSFNGGTLKLTGGPWALGAGDISSDRALGDPPCVVLENMTGTFADDNRPINVGACGWQKKFDSRAIPKDSTGILIIRNSQILDDKPNGDIDGTSDNIDVGGGYATGRGIVEIEGDNTVVRAKLRVSHNWGSSGSVIQRSGTVINSGNARDNMEKRPSSLGYNGTGYYELRKGTYRQLGAIQHATNGDMIDGIFAQYGGKFISEARPDSSGALKGYWNAGGSVASSYANNPSASENQYACATFYQKAGYAVVSNVLYACSGTAGRADFTFDGPEATFRLDTSATHQIVRAHNQVVTFNVNNGAVFETGLIKKYSTSATNTALRINFDGGTIRALQDGDFFGSGSSLCNVKIFKGGMTLDTDGHDVTIKPVLARPTGMGVASVTIPSNFSTMKLVCPPAIRIYGGGNGRYVPGAYSFGATAVAVYDSATRTIAGVDITCPGDGFAATPNVRFSLANSTYSATATLAANDQTGGFTKTGEGTATLAETNTWGGATTVAGGTLKAGIDWAIPSNTVVNLTGGTLDLDGKKAAFSQINFAGGALAGASALAMPADWTIDILQSTPATINGALVFPEGCTITLVNSDQAVDKARYTLLRFPDGATGDTPAIEGLPTVGKVRWMIERSATELRLVQPRGTALYFR